MCDNVASNRLLCICCEHGATVDLGHDLVRNDDGYTKLICDSLQRPQELRQVHLSGGELTSAAIVRAVQGCGAVNDHESEAVLGHQSSCLQQKLILLVGVVSSRIGYII